MILVTGGAGFIGSNLVASLQEKGLGPIAICDRFRQGNKWRNVAKHPITAAVHPDDLMDWLNGEGADTKVIFHLGACSSTTETDVDYIWRNNVQFSMDLWHWCETKGRRFIYASSAATYGNGELGFDDDESVGALDALRPLNPYGWSKKVVDCNAVRLAAQGKAPKQWAGLKFFNVYGPNEYHKGGQQSVVAQLFKQINETGGARLFKSHHPDYEDGGQMRDFVWVGDVVNIMIWLYQNPEVSGIFNCGAGKARSFADLARATFAAMDVPVNLDFIETPENIRKHYQYYTEAKMTKLRGMGMDLNSTSLEDGVADYVKNYLMSEDQYR